MEKEKTKPFEKWTRDDVSDLGYIQKYHSPFLDNCLSFDVDSIENSTLNELRNLLANNGQIWNEQELFCSFIVPMFKLVKINDLAYREFMGRTIKMQLEVEKIKLLLELSLFDCSLVVTLLIASPACATVGDVVDFVALLCAEVIIGLTAGVFL